jgi:hypothetical protein
MARPARRQRWSWFVIGVGIVLLVLCLAEPSTAALVAGLVLLVVGVVAVAAGF